MHYYKRNLGDYAKKAGRLSMLQHGSYTLLIDACYDREQFPTMDEAIEWTWASSAAEIEAVEFVLRKFFTLEGGVYVQKRIQEEIAEYRLKAETNKRIATERETNRKAKSTNRSPDVDEVQPNHKPVTNNQEPLTNNQKPVEKQKHATATRLPADWYPSQADIEFCKTTRPDLQHSVVREAFRDYWIAVPGAKGKKADWPATWRNWIRNQRQTSPPAGYESEKDRSRREFTESIFGKAKHEPTIERDITGSSIRVD